MEHVLAVYGSSNAAPRALHALNVPTVPSNGDWTLSQLKSRAMTICARR